MNLKIKAMFSVAILVLLLCSVFLASSKPYYEQKEIEKEYESEPIRDRDRLRSCEEDNECEPLRNRECTCECHEECNECECEEEPYQYRYRERYRYRHGED